MPEDEVHQQGQIDSAHATAHDPELFVTDDWPEIVPVTDAELRVFEAYFGGLVDEILRPVAHERTPT
jgi:hypothetical protein